MAAADTTPQKISDAVVASLLGDVLMPMEEGNERSGDFVGVFRLSEKIGEGGFGVVWRGGQVGHGRRRVGEKEV